MKHLRNLVLFVLLASSQFAYSAEGCDPCDPCYATTECDLCNVSFCDMEFEAYVDALYWHGCSNNLYIYENDENMNPDYSWGWRIGASAYWNTWDFGFRYTSFNANTKNEVNYGSESFATAEYKFDYQVFDLEVGRACCICDGIMFRPFLGGKFAEIKIDHINFDESDHYEVKLSGAGLYVGFDNRWQICSFDVCDRSIPVALVSRVSTGVLDADFKTGEHEEFEYKECQFVPVHDLYAGLEFRMCGLCDADAFFQIGYEAQYWGFRQIDSDGELSHLGLGGLVLRFGANF